MLSFFRVVKRKIRKKSKKNISAKKILTYKKYLSQKEITRKLVLEKLETYKNIYFNLGHDLSFNKVAIRDQKTRWGSCSSKKNLNFNYKLSLIPNHLFDYVIIHELCHLKEMNHAKAFWDLVSLVCPNYLELKEELKIIDLRKL